MELVRGAIDPAPSCAALAWSNASSSVSAHLAQLGDSAGLDPLGEEDVGRGVETPCVWMQELAGDPAFSIRAAAELHVVLQHLLAPRGVFAQMRDTLVVLAKQADASTQVRHEQDIVQAVEVGWQD